MGRDRVSELGSAARTRRTVIIASVAAGVALVIAAAAAATVYVSDEPDQASPAATSTAVPSSNSAAPSAPSTSPPTPAVPTVTGTDVGGFVGTPARCSAGDPVQMVVQTASSQAVICQRAAGAYYAGWRPSTQSSVRVENITATGSGWVARAPDATVTITADALMFDTPAGDFTEPATAAWVQ